MLNFGIDGPEQAATVVVLPLRAAMALLRLHACESLFSCSSCSDYKFATSYKCQYIFFIVWAVAQGLMHGQTSKNWICSSRKILTCSKSPKCY